MGSAIRKVLIVDSRMNFVCLREECPRPCCGPFGGVQEGIESIEGRDFAEIVLTSRDCGRLVAHGHSRLIRRSDSGHYGMRLHDDGACVAFENGRCGIHPVKPTLCRAYPFYIDMFVGLCGVTSCPGFGAGWTDVSRLAGELEATKEMYEYWLSTAGRAPDRLSAGKEA